MHAASNGEFEIVKWLCEMKADVECKSVVRMMRVFDVLDVRYVIFQWQLCNLHVFMYNIMMNEALSNNALLCM